MLILCHQCNKASDAHDMAQFCQFCGKWYADSQAVLAYYQLCRGNTKRRNSLSNKLYHRIFAGMALCVIGLLLVFWVLGLSFAFSVTTKLVILLGLLWLFLGRGWADQIVAKQIQDPVHPQGLAEEAFD